MASVKEDLVEYLLDLLHEKKTELKQLTEELNSLKEVVKFYETEWLRRTQEQAQKQAKKSRVVCDCGEVCGSHGNGAGFDEVD